MRPIKGLTVAAAAFALVAVPLAMASADDSHHPMREAAEAPPMAGSPGGTMGPGTMGSGAMGAMMMGPGMIAAMHGGGMEFPPHAAMRGALSLTAAQARDLVEARLILHGNDRLRVGSVETAADGFVATVETVDGSLVRTLRIDPATGALRPAE